MKTVIHRPDASAVVNSLRAIGYSFDTALADIIDNSLAAGARNVDIGFRSEPRLYVAILDDGSGMSADALLSAMQHGGNGPGFHRRPDDLGRYGLGLKTASLSQCRKLSVVTLRAGQMFAACWDLDVVETTREWSLQVYEGEDADVLPRVSELREAGHGTVVIWENFDRATAGESDVVLALQKLIDDSRAHLSLTFHRYIAPAKNELGCRIAINALDLEAYDPFITSNPMTVSLPCERVVLDGSPVEIQPYLLPHLSNISREEMERAGGGDRLRLTQGFYLYRSRRLITYGTWFRLVRHHELTKLARVRIDIPNSLDHLWGLDVKKSTANPPEAVRAVLRRITDRIADSGANVFRERRRRQAKDDTVHLWERSKVRGAIVYSINRDHPFVGNLVQELSRHDVSQLEQLLTAIEIALPADAIYADMAADKPIEQPALDITASLSSLAGALLSAAGNDVRARSGLLAAIPLMDPFSMFPNHTRQLIEELRNA